MKKYIQLGIILAMFAIGGCGMSEGKEEKPVSGGGTPSQEMPKTAAFQDEFTRGYMASPKEVEPGYYLFKSKTGGYTMLFPKDGRISSKIGFEQKKNTFETFIFEQISKDKSNVENQITFENSPASKDIESNLTLLSTKTGYNGKFNKKETKNATIYYSKILDENSDLFQYFSFIKSNSNQKSLSIITSFTCRNSKESCRNNTPKYEEYAFHLMNSVNFTKE